MGLKTSTKRFVLSDETKNLLGFITKTDGIDLAAFQDNPVMLYNHDYEKLIGEWQDYRIEGTKLTAAPAFDEDDTFAMQQFNKVEAGILKGASVGLSPVKFNKDKAELSNSLLLEASLTPVPNNRAALAIYNAKGIKLNASEVKEYLLSVERTDTTITTENNMNEKLKAALVALCVLAGQTITLSADASDEAIELAIKKVGEKITSLEGEKVTLTADVAALKKAETDAVEKEITDAVAKAVEEKLLTAEQAPALIAFGKLNLSAFKTTLAAMKPVSLTVVPGAGAETAADAADRKAWTFDDYAGKDPVALSAMEVADPDKFKLLLSAKQAKVRATGQIGTTHA